MPIYEYACKSCSHTLDVLQKMNDDPLVECPECGKPELRRLISAPRFRLKGEGWYETDFKQDKQRNLAKGDSEAVKSDSDSKTVKKDSTETVVAKTSKDSAKTETKPKVAEKKDNA